MEKGKAKAVLADSLQTLSLYSNPKSNSSSRSSYIISDSQSFVRPRTKPRRLVNLCLGVLGRHLEEILGDLGQIAGTFPADIKMALAAIARRRGLLNDDVLIALADNSWEVLDISKSDVSDLGLTKVAEVCGSLRALDVSKCDRITPDGVSVLISLCHSLETLRCGGCPRSNRTARICLGLLKPNLNNVDGDTWEELDANEIASGSESLRWLVWPNIDKESQESFSIECPRIMVNPKPSHKGTRVPIEALLETVLDDPIVRDIDPKTWEVRGFVPKETSASVSCTPELSIAEKFRLAFVERDNRLAKKRARKARQNQRRAAREIVSWDPDAKAIALASQMRKSLHGRS